MSENTKCKKCRHEDKLANEHPCRVCTRNKGVDHYAPMTNADRIRNMTDEELADFLLEVNCAYVKPCMTGENDCKWEDYPTHDKGCKDCFLEWLQAEVKEGAE